MTLVCFLVAVINSVIVSVNGAGPTKQMRAIGLEVERHLAYEKHDAADRNDGNSHNGTRAKPVTTEIGPVQIESWTSRARMLPGFCRRLRRQGYAQETLPWVPH